MSDRHRTSRCCQANGRRQFLADMGQGFFGLALGAILARDGVLRADTELEPTLPGAPHFPARAKSVIWIFLVGGMSHLETLDAKPVLNQYAGQEIGETPYRELPNRDFGGRVRPFAENNDNGKMRSKIFPLQVGFQRGGQSGLEISDWLPHLRERADDLAIVRSMWTTDNDHGAQLQFHTGRHVLEGQFPTIGSWTHYGLGTLNDNLPQFVVLGTPIADCCGGVGAHGANYLGPEHQGVQLGVDPTNPLPYALPGQDVFREEQEAQFALLHELNGLAAAEYPSDAALRARIKSYELAFRMQTAVPAAVDLAAETAETQQLYGLDQGTTERFGRHCLAARRLVERGVRFVQLFHGSNGGAGEWDAHGGLKNNHTNLCGQIDKPLAGLLSDLKRRGLLEETLVVLGTEFGRTPGSQGSDGRDHHPQGFSVMLAGGGVRGGTVHGETDELGFHAAVDRHYVTDLHATVLWQLGLDPRRLEIPGRKRLEIDFGQPIRQILV